MAELLGSAPTTERSDARTIGELLSSPDRCPVRIGHERCVLETGHSGLHQNFFGPNPHNDPRAAGR